MINLSISVAPVPQGSTHRAVIQVSVHEDPNFPSPREVRMPACYTEEDSMRDALNYVQQEWKRRQHSKLFGPQGGER
ncbi:MAG TPA: hypothetical protein VHY84_27495 [Bryobacteraceae bacterium]|jgi:hypothetical protein|nr:hypothetical protein [Bryobacteraceae bacterium]